MADITEVRKRISVGVRVSNYGSVYPLLVNAILSRTRENYRTIRGNYRVIRVSYKVMRDNYHVLCDIKTK